MLNYALLLLVGIATALTRPAVIEDSASRAPVHARREQTVSIFTSQGGSLVDLAVTLTEGRGRIRIVCVTDAGREKVDEFEYSSNGEGRPWGMVIGGKIKLVELVAQVDTAGTITVDRKAVPP